MSDKQTAIIVPFYPSQGEVINGEKLTGNGEQGFRRTTNYLGNAPKNIGNMDIYLDENESIIQILRLWRRSVCRCRGQKFK